MLVCHCRRVSDIAIRTAVRNGARSRNDVGEQCEAGTRCGGCLPMVDRLIDEEQSAKTGQALPMAGQNGRSA